MTGIVVVKTKHEFKIVAEFRPQMLGETIEKHLRDGWALHGNVFVHGDSVCQALSRRTEADQQIHG